MRFKQVYVLRLLVDDELPNRLQGALSPVKDAGRAYSFCSDEALLDLLHQLTAVTGNVQVDATAAPTSCEPKLHKDVPYNQSTNEKQPWKRRKP